MNLNRLLVLHLSLCLVWRLVRGAGGLVLRSARRRLAKRARIADKNA